MLGPQCLLLTYAPVGPQSDGWLAWVMARAERRRIFKIAWEVLWVEQLS